MPTGARQVTLMAIVIAMATTHALSPVLYAFNTQTKIIGYLLSGTELLFYYY